MGNEVNYIYGVAINFLLDNFSLLVSITTEPKCESRFYFGSFVNHKYINKYIQANK